MTFDRKLWQREYRKKHKEKISIRRKEHYRQHKEQEKAQQKIYREKNREKIRTQQRAYRLKPKSKRKYWECEKRRREINLQHLTAHRLRHSLLKALKIYGNGKLYSSKKYGIDWIPAIQKLIETKPVDFSERKYHIDHAIPISAFDLTDAKQIQMAFSPDNLQWLTAEENLSKHDKII